MNFNLDAFPPPWISLLCNYLADSSPALAVGKVLALEDTHMVPVASTFSHLKCKTMLCYNNDDTIAILILSIKNFILKKLLRKLWRKDKVEAMKICFADSY